MAVTTQLLGRLGGTPETQTVEITSSDQDVSIPAGWKRAVGVYNSGQMYRSATVFGQIASPPSGGYINGGAVLTAGETSQFINANGTITWYRLE